MPETDLSPLRLPNIRRFLAFRAFFHARFYYPVFTVLFLDFGLTLEQFALLNTVWACTIVLSEVPSGALADFWGRKRLLAVAAALHSLSLLLLVLTPAGRGALVFWTFLISRVLGGLAEAMSSGSDEALAYDTLVEYGLAGQWPLVLDWKMRIQSLAFILAMTAGAALYDQNLLNRLLAATGTSLRLEHGLSMRLPLLCTLGFALCALGTSLGMREPGGRSAEPDGLHARRVLVVLTLRTWRVGLWLLRAPLALTVVLLAMSLDHVLRFLASLTSPYYRLIGLPDASFGLIGSGVALLGLAVPRLARFMAERLSPGWNALLLSLLMPGLLWLVGCFIPMYGVLPMAGVFVGLMLTSFFTSHYLNALTPSSQRATVLSFKSMVFNLAYGVLGIGFAVLLRHEEALVALHCPNAPASQVENLAFQAALRWGPGYLAAVLVLAALLSLPGLLRQRRLTSSPA